MENKGQSARRGRTLVAHIGLPKTGSTSIQHMLWTLAAPLSALGVHVPVAAQDPHGSHVNLVREYNSSGADYRPWLGNWADLQEELDVRRAVRRFAVTTEAFSLAPGGAIRRIAAIAEAASLDLQIVAYVRPQDQQMESAYAQAIKSGSTMSFEVFRRRGLDSPSYDYDTWFRPWRAAFGDRLAIYPLAPARMPKGLLPHFLEVLGASGLAAAAADLPRLNRRIGAKHLEVMRLVNVALHREMTDRVMRRRVERYLRRTLPAVLHNDGPFVGLHREERLTIARHFEEPNARLAREYGLDSEGPLFSRTAGDGAVRPNHAHWTDMSDKERVAVTRLVRTTAGVDLMKMPRAWHRDTRSPKARRSVDQTPPSALSPGEIDFGRPSGRWKRLCLLGKQVLRRTAPGAAPWLVASARVAHHLFFAWVARAARAFEELSNRLGDAPVAGRRRR